MLNEKKGVAACCGARRCCNSFTRIGILQDAFGLSAIRGQCSIVGRMIGARFFAGVLSVLSCIISNPLPDVLMSIYAFHLPLLTLQTHCVKIPVDKRGAGTPSFLLWLCPDRRGADAPKKVYMIRHEYIFWLSAICFSKRGGIAYFEVLSACGVLLTSRNAWKRMRPLFLASK